MPEVRIMVHGRAYQVAVDEQEMTSARAAAELLQAELSGLKSTPNSPVSAANDLVLSGMKIADKLLDLKQELKTTNDEISRLRTEVERKPPVVRVPVADQVVLHSLENFARRTEALAERLDEVLTD